MGNTVFEDIVIAFLIVWALWSSTLIFLPSAAVLQLGDHRHITVIYSEDNNTQIQKELSAIAEKYTKD